MKQSQRRASRPLGDPILVPTLYPRVVLCATYVALLMVFVGLVLATIGILALKLSGGAATDTSIVIVVTAYLVTDFWGGALVASFTGARRDAVATAWAIARGGALVLSALAFPNLWVAVPLQLSLGVLAAWFGARMAHKQAHLRRADAVARRGSALAE